MYEIGEEEIAAVTEVLRSKHLFRYYAKGAPDIGHRGEANRFEDELGAFTRTPHAVAVSSGSAALQAALVGLGIGPGDEVIVPGFTFVATAHAVLAVGAVPVVANVDETLTLDVADCARRITARTRAIVPVHMAGLPCDMDAILALAKARGLAVVEDACQAIGGTYRGKPLGSLGDAGCFSFNQFKAVTCGEGGALVTRDRRLYERALVYHDPGYSFVSAGIAIDEPRFAGMNFRTNEMQAAMLRVQLRKLPGWIDALRSARSEVRAALRGHPLLREAPMHDPEGGAASVLCLLLPTEDAARALVHAVRAEGIVVGWPAEQRLHVVDRWDALLAGRGGHVDAMNPLRDRAPLDVASYETTRNLTRRTVGVVLWPSWDAAERADLVTKLLRAAEATSQDDRPWCGAQ